MLIEKKYITIFIYLIFYRREIVKLSHFMTLSLCYANTILRRSRCKIHRRFIAAPFHPKQHSRHFKASFNVIISVYIGL